MLKVREENAIERAVVWEKTRAYTDHGCNITGTLFVARMGKACKEHPKWGMFGAGVCHDVADIARNVLTSRGISYEEALAVPDVVFRVALKDWNEFATEVEEV